MLVGRELSVGFRHKLPFAMSHANVGNVPVYATRIDLLFASPSGFAPLVFAPSCVDQCAVPQATLLHRTIMELGAASGR